MSRKDVEALKQRALDFLHAVEDDLKSGMYELAAFHCEQAVQLALKYVLAVELGHYPHTRNLRELFEEVKQVKPNLWLLYEKHKYAVEVMNDAYISARYLPRTYGEDVVKGLYEVATVVLNEVGIR
ncbi:MAG: DNA-binding protein [Zestosphaera tikiterensis]|uniref:DNA-binding protein n=1 Tax=Zestosphaera tikiterensis TaxID=1973259 RepID=A0A2R7Y6A3_9CREN|nr:MAG: DNA-binding protein [Zestosphaera tikiterensis]